MKDYVFISCNLCSILLRIFMLTFYFVYLNFFFEHCINCNLRAHKHNTLHVSLILILFIVLFILTFINFLRGYVLLLLCCGLSTFYLINEYVCVKNEEMYLHYLRRQHSQE